MHVLAVLLAALALLAAGAVPAAAAPEGQLTWGVHTTLVPSYAFSAAYEDVRLKAR